MRSSVARTVYLLCFEKIVHLLRLHTVAFLVFLMKLEGVFTQFSVYSRALCGDLLRCFITEFRNSTTQPLNYTRHGITLDVLIRVNALYYDAVRRVYGGQVRELADCSKYAITQAGRV